MVSEVFPPREKLFCKFYAGAVSADTRKRRHNDRHSHCPERCFNFPLNVFRVSSVSWLDPTHKVKWPNPTRCKSNIKLWIRLSQTHFCTIFNYQKIWYYSIVSKLTENIMLQLLIIRNYSQRIIGFWNVNYMFIRYFLHWTRPNFNPLKTKNFVTQPDPTRGGTRPVSNSGSESGCYHAEMIDCSRMGAGKKIESLPNAVDHLCM